MTAADIEAGLRLCRIAGWNQLEADWRCFLECSPNGCRAATADGRVVGTVSTLCYQVNFGWISMLLVDPEWRGQGIGTRLLHEACDILSGVETIRLDATPAGKLVYDQCGFHDEYPLVRMKAASPAVVAAPEVRPFRESDLAWDMPVFGADRSGLLRRLWLAAPEYAFASDRGGFVLGRHGFLAEQIGPLVAEDEATARALASAAMAQSQCRPVMIDAPGHTPSWNRWLQSCGFREERPFIRMYRGPNSCAGAPGNVYAIAGPELG